MAIRILTLGRSSPKTEETDIFAEDVKTTMSCFCERFFPKPLSPILFAACHCPQNTNRTRRMIQRKTFCLRSGLPKGGDPFLQQSASLAQSVPAGPSHESWFFCNGAFETGPGLAHQIVQSQSLAASVLTSPEIPQKEGVLGSGITA